MTELIEEIDWQGKVVAIRTKEELKKRMFPHKVSLIIPRASQDKFMLASVPRISIHFQILGAALWEGK